jgi:hypothetical protein
VDNCIIIIIIIWGAREDTGDMERYWNINEGVRDIMGYKERDLAMTGFLGLIMSKTHI